MENNLMPQVNDAPKEEVIADRPGASEGSNLKIEIQENTEDTVEHPDSEEMVEVEVKPKIPLEDIFKDVKPVVKKPKRRRQMNAKALESLALAREKANATRQRNKEARIKGEMLTPTEQKEKEKEIAEEKKRPVVNNITHKTENITNTITHEDIEAIVQKSTKKTLEEYDLTRKARKEKKKKDNEEETQKQQVRDTILKAQGLKYGNDGFYGGCF
jgi:hypothetical protein